jgi:hypothetical protein
MPNVLFSFADSANPDNVSASCQVGVSLETLGFTDDDLQNLGSHIGQTEIVHKNCGNPANVFLTDITLTGLSRVIPL